MGTVAITGSLIAAPASSSDSGFPSGVTTIPFELASCTKRAPSQTGSQVRQVNSPSTYVALDGVGTNNTVPKGDTLYMRTQVPFKVRLTFADASVITNLPLQGLFILELDPANMLTLLEAEGAGQIEWFVSGPSA